MEHRLVESVSIMNVDLTEALSYEEIPIKLRCASCNKLVADAFRLPCCDQNICGTCHSSVPESCPICTHNPLSAEACKANKSLRLTVKAFLKNEERKRGKGNGINAASANDTAQEGEQHTDSAPAETLEHKTDDFTASNGEQPLTGLNLVNQTPELPIMEEQDTKTDVERPIQTTSVVEFRDQQQSSALHENEQMISTSTLEPMGKGACGGLVASEQPNWSAGFSNHGLSLESGANGANWNFNGQLHQMMAMNAFNAIPWPNFPGHFVAGMQNINMNHMAMPKSMFDGFGGPSIGSDGTGVGFGGYDAFGNWINGPAMVAGFMHGEPSANAGHYPRDGYNQQSHRAHLNQMHQPVSMNNNNRVYPRGRGLYRPGFDRDSNHPAFQELHVSEAQEQSEVARRTSSDPRLSSQDNEEVQSLNTLSKIPVLTSEEERETENYLNEGDYTIPSVATAINTLGWGHDNSSVTETGHESAVNTDIIEAKHEEHLQNRPHDHYRARFAVDSSVSEPNSGDGTHVAFGTVKPPSGPAASLNTLRAVSDFSVRGRGNNRSMNHSAPRGHGYRSSFSANKIVNTPTIPYGQMGQGVPGAPTGPKAMRTKSSNSNYRGVRLNSLTATEEQKSKVRYSEDEAVAGEDQGLIPKPALTEPSIHRRNSQDSHEPIKDSHSVGRCWNDDSSYQSRSAASRRSTKDVMGHRSLSPSSKNPDQVEGRKVYQGSSSKQHFLRQDKSRSRETRRRRHRSQSLCEGHNEDGVSRLRATDNEEERSVRTKTQRYNLGSDRYRDRETRKARHEHDQQRRYNDPIATSSTVEKDVLSTSSGPATYSSNVPTTPREFKIKDRSKWSEVDDKTNLIREGPGVDAHSLEREARNRERLLREHQKRQSLNIGSKRRRNSNASEERNDINIERDSDNIKQRKTPRIERRKPSFYYQDDGYGESRADIIEREREEARWR